MMTLQELKQKGYVLCLPHRTHRKTDMQSTL